MSFNYKLTFIFILTFLSFVYIKNINAATGPEEIFELQEKVNYTVKPEKPNLGDSIQIQADMYGTKVSDSDFTWKINGKLFKNGVGVNKIIFALSEKTTVDLSIITKAGVKIDKSFNFDPKKIILIWESRTYTPPFFRGKSLYAPESSLVLNAINLDQENPLTNTYNNYKWTVDGVVKGSVSGVGYSSYSYQGDILKREPLFTVDVSGVKSYKDTKENSFNNQAVLRVQTMNTEIISYEKNPLLGVLFNRKINSEYKLNKTETTMVSYPLYYGVSSTLSSIYSWYINDVKINNTSNELSFKKKKDGELSRLSVRIKNMESILQSRDILYIIDTNK